MSLILKSNHIVPTDNAIGRAVTVGADNTNGVALTGAYTNAFEFASGSGISAQTSGSLTMTKKIAIKDDEGNTIYIQAGTIA